MARLRFRLDHLFAARRLSDYVDDGLARGERDRLRRHLSVCADCGRAESSLRLLLGHLRLLRGQRSMGVTDQVIERVRAADRPPEHAGRR